MSEEYSVGYSEGYQAGWNAAMDATPPAQPAPVQEPLHDEKVRLIAHNECPEDWDSLDNKECWLKGFVSGFKTAEREYKE